MRLKHRSRRKAALNLTSLIDVLFILIIFFAVSSTFLEQPGIELKLPEAESSEAHVAQKVIVYVDHQENIFLNDKPVNLEELADAVESLVSTQTEKSVVLRADGEAKHGTIITIMDLLLKKGIYKIIVSTEKPSFQTTGR
jgi:biopolymer transport protein ExbD